MEDLNITYASLLTNGSRLTYAYAVSPDGRFIVGPGYNAATGRGEAYLLDTQGTTSVEAQGVESGLESQLRIMPTPSEESVTLRFVSELSGAVALEVVDVLGKTVFQWNDYLESGGSQSIGMSLRGLPSGLYHVRLLLPSQQVLIAPLVVVR